MHVQNCDVHCTRLKCFRFEFNVLRRPFARFIYFILFFMFMIVDSLFPPFLYFNRNVYKTDLILLICTYIASLNQIIKKLIKQHDKDLNGICFTQNVLNQTFIIRMYQVKKEYYFLIAR